MTVHFGWRTPDFPLDGSSSSAFRDQHYAVLDEIQGIFDSAWIADHFQPWMASLDQRTDTFECLTTLIYLCAKYPGLDFGTIVMSQSYRPPALLAKMASVLQTLSDGRFILGIGAGWKEDEYRSYGYDYPSPQIRIQQLDEAVQIIRGMFTLPKTTFHGKYYHVDEAICEPKPQPVPPIMIGGTGRKLTLRVVAKYADWWNGVGLSLDQFKEVSGILDEHCLAVGRDPKSVIRTFSTDCVSVASTSEEAESNARASRFYNANSGIIGTPDEVSARIEQYIQVGVEHFILRFVDFPGLDGIRLFRDEVLPRFKEK
jgi:alkanesulfonate monooxygenase SsuD/methylene tetrahydromethanopterin reductase-like flavin-dependent oxidoreductase (luciferase family)